MIDPYSDTATKLILITVEIDTKRKGIYINNVVISLLLYYAVEMFLDLIKSTDNLG